MLSLPLSREKGKEKHKLHFVFRGRTGYRKCINIYEKMRRKGLQDALSLYRILDIY